MVYGVIQNWITFVITLCTIIIDNARFPRLWAQLRMATLALFEDVVDALKLGKKICRAHWDTGTTLFFQDGDLVQQSLKGRAQTYSLDGYELLATDWSICDARDIYAEKVFAVQ